MARSQSPSFSSILYSYNISPNPFCPSCGGAFETINHLFFNCTSFVNFCIDFLNDLNRILSLVSATDVILREDGKCSDDALIDIALRGAFYDSNFNTSFQINKLIFRAISNYLCKTGRFPSLKF